MRRWRLCNPEGITGVPKGLLPSPHTAYPLLFFHCNKAKAV